MKAKRTKSARGRWSACTAGGCNDVENLSIPKSLRTQTTCPWRISVRWKWRFVMSGTENVNVQVEFEW